MIVLAWANAVQCISWLLMSTSRFFGKVSMLLVDFSDPEGANMVLIMRIYIIVIGGRGRGWVVVLEGVLTSLARDPNGICD